MPNNPTKTTPTYAVVPVDPVDRLTRVPSAGELVPANRLTKLIPRSPTTREREVGREVAYRATIQASHTNLQASAAIAIARMHDHTNQVVVAEVQTMNARVRAVAHDEDRSELREIAAAQKAMFVRHQFGVLEAGCYRVARETDRELYAEHRGGLRGWIKGE